MCGICGVVNPSEDFESAVLAMQWSLVHRGPDDEGIDRAAGAILGHRRLSIIDLSPTGKQPMWDASRSACIVFNGEIYNFPALREECVSRGRSFRGTSDTEVILNLYLLDGTAAFARLDGMFALCLVDARSGEAFLVRDPMGVKPLYYADRPDGLFFASELGALVDAGVVGVDVDEAALQAYLQLDYVPGPMSILRGARKLTGGAMLRVGRDGSRSIERFAAWDDGVESSAALPESVDAFDALIRDSVRRQLVADVPVGVFLSGGIDSSIIALVASKFSESRIHTFSIGFDEPSFDESRWAEMVARAAGTEHHSEIVDAKRALDLVPKIAAITTEPIADGSILPTYLLCEFARRSVKVALTGDGADELFGGYPTYGMRGIATLLSRLPAGLRRAMSGIANAVLPVDYGNLTTGYKARKFLGGLDPNPVLRNQRWLGTFAPETLPRLLVQFDPTHLESLRGLMLEPAAGVRGRGTPEALLRTDQRFYMQDQVLVKADRASMTCSLELRPPFLSDPVVRFARALPSSQKVWQGSHKRLLREWVAKRLPAEIAARPKKGFGAPLGMWFRGELRELVGDTLSSDAMRRIGFFRPETVDTLLREHWSGRADRRKEIFNLLCFTLWLGEMKRRAGVPREPRAGARG